MAEYFVRVGVNSTHQHSVSSQQKPNHDKQRKSASSPKVFATTVKIASCPHCSGAHRLHLCETFKALNPTQRSEIIKEKRCCYRCINNRHLSSECTQAKECGVEECKRLHHPLIHSMERCLMVTTTRRLCCPSSLF